MLEITIREYNSVAIFELSGTLDVNASNFIEKIGRCFESGYNDILCDFEGVSLLDYSGLSVLTIAYRNALNHKARIKFVNMPAHIQKVLSFACLDRVLEIYSDKDTALKSFQEDRSIAEVQKMHLRRRFKRLDLDILFYYKSLSEKEFYSGKVLNISAVGMLVFSENRVYPIGETLNIQITLSGILSSIELEAKVVWLVEKDIQPQIYPGMGLAFCNIDSLTQEKIVEFVERNLPLNSSTECS
ncbi:MAG: PilZ domain-containing protein [Candidatus Omnitrophota bacterium]|nr:PilZ domain-containing protein [Candidatus Omnitrophota bacterium]